MHPTSLPRYVQTIEHHDAFSGKLFLLKRKKGKKRRKMARKPHKECVGKELFIVRGSGRVVSPRAKT
jgi:hypothetical protein